MKSEFLNKWIRCNKTGITYHVTRVTNHNHGFYIRVLHLFSIHNNKAYQMQLSEDMANKLIKSKEMEVLHDTAK